MHVGICDDLQQDIDEVRSWLSNRDPTEEINIVEFHSGIDVLAFIRNRNRLDVLFLDCRMDVMSGLQTTARIREIDHTMVIILTTRFLERFASDISGMEIFTFIDKHKLASSLAASWRRVVAYVHALRGPMFTYESDGYLHCIPISDILYFSSERNLVNIHLLGGPPQSFYRALRDVEADLRQHGFVRVHASFLANSHYIRRLSYTEALLCEGTALPVSRTHYKAAFAWINDYLHEVAICSIF